MDDLYREFAARFPKPDTVPIFSSKTFSRRFPAFEPAYRQTRLQDIPEDVLIALFFRESWRAKPEETAYFVPRLVELWPKYARSIMTLIAPEEIRSLLSRSPSAAGNLWTAARAVMDQRLLGMMDAFTIIHIQSRGVDYVAASAERLAALQSYLSLPVEEFQRFVDRWAGSASPHHALHFMHTCASIARSRPKRVATLRSGRPCGTENDRLWLAFEKYLADAEGLKRRLGEAIRRVPLPDSWEQWMRRDLQIR